MPGPDQVRVGVVGCGTISTAYLTNMKASPHLRVVACADAVPQRAEQRATEFGLRALAPEELVTDPDVELVVNLTVPNAHAPINLASLKAGKHVYTEKPFAATREEASSVLEEAAKRGLQVGCAPDTFLGSGLQTCFLLLQRGDLGDPLAASAFMLNRGPENWHPNPGFFFSAGGGPMLDVGPYHVTALVCMLGPARRVTGMSRILYPERKAERGPRAGEVFTVTTSTFVAGLIEFESGAVATLVMSFGISGHDLPHMQVYCSGGILGVPDPNYFGGPVRVRAAGEESMWQEQPLLYRHTAEQPPRNHRGLGVAEMAQGLRRGQAPRASGELGFHVLDVMLGIQESHDSGRHVEISSRVRPPPLLPVEQGVVGV